MTKKSESLMIRADRKDGSEKTAPRLTISTTDDGYESLFLGKLTSTEGRVAYLRIWRGGYRILFQTRTGLWMPDGYMETHSEAISTQPGVLNALEALGFTPDADTEELLSKLPRDAVTAHNAIVGYRHPLKYIPDDLALAREAAPGKRLFRGV